MFAESNWNDKTKKGQRIKQITKPAILFYIMKENGWNVLKM